MIFGRVEGPGALRARLFRSRRPYFVPVNDLLLASHVVDFKIVCLAYTHMGGGGAKKLKNFRSKSPFTF